MKVIAPEGAREKIADVVAVDTTSPDFGDPGVTFVTVPGTAHTRQRSSCAGEQARRWC